MIIHDTYYLDITLIFNKLYKKDLHKSLYRKKNAIKSIIYEMFQTAHNIRIDAHVINTLLTFSEVQI